MTHKTTRAVLIGTLLLAPVIAQANCPTADMIDTGGIKFTSGPGEYEIHSRAPNGTILQVVYYGGWISQNTLAHGVHVLSLADVENGQFVQDSIWLFNFDVAIDALPEPVAGGTWSARTQQLFMGDVMAETVLHKWGPLTTYTIGTCTLDAIPVVVQYKGAAYNHTEEAMYFPDLGTGILTAYEDEDGRDDYTYATVGKP